MYSYISSLRIASDRSFFSMLTQLNRVETQRLIPWWYQWFCPGGIGGFRMIPSWELTFFPLKRVTFELNFPKLPVWCCFTPCDRESVWRFVALVTWDLHAWGQKTCCSILKKSSVSRSDHELTLLSVSWLSTMEKWMRFVCCWRSEAFFPLQGIISNCIQFLIKRITSIKCFLQLSLAIHYPPN